MKRVILAGALALTGFACAARSQLDVPADGQESLGVAGDTGKPRLLNQQDLIRAIEREYPPMLRERLIRGTTSVHILIDEEGIVRDRKVSKSSGHSALDDAALRVVRVARFSPAKNRDGPVALWIALDITFTPGQARPRVRLTPTPESRARDGESAARTFDDLKIPDMSVRTGVLFRMHGHASSLGARLKGVRAKMRRTIGSKNSSGSDS